MPELHGPQLDVFNLFDLDERAKPGLSTEQIGVCGQLTTLATVDLSLCRADRRLSAVDNTCDRRPISVPSRSASAGSETALSPITTELRRKFAQTKLVLRPVSASVSVSGFSYQPRARSGGQNFGIRTPEISVSTILVAAVWSRSQFPSRKFGLRLGVEGAVSRDMAASLWTALSPISIDEVSLKSRRGNASRSPPRTRSRYLR